MEELTAWQRWRMCDRKKPYSSRSKANKAAHKRDMYSYECPICFAFHITKMPRPEQKQSTPQSTIQKTEGSKPEIAGYVGQGMVRSFRTRSGVHNSLFLLPRVGSTQPFDKPEEL